MANKAEKKIGSGPEGTDTLTVIAQGTTFTGEIISDGIVKVEGVVSGVVRATRQVLVARGGLVDGDIFTREANVGGEIKGTIHAEERVELQAESVVHGDITTQRMLIHEGGEVNGFVKMGALATKTASQPHGTDSPPMAHDTTDRSRERATAH